MVTSIEMTAALLMGRFTFAVGLSAGYAPLLGSNALHRKFSEYLERAKAKVVEQQLRLGSPHTNYPSLVASLSVAGRQELENRVTLRAWSAAKGPFLEVLCLLADLYVRESPPGLFTIQLFEPSGPIEVRDGVRQEFVWVQPQLKHTRSRMTACPDILIKTVANLHSAATVVALHECKCHRRLPSDELRQECGKAFDLGVWSYVIVTYHPQSARVRSAVEGLGLRIRDIGLYTEDREAFVKGERNMAVELGEKLAEDDRSSSFRETLRGDERFEPERTDGDD